MSWKSQSQKAIKENFGKGKALGSTLGVASGTLELANTAIDNAQNRDTTGIKNNITEQNSLQFNGSDTNTLLSEWGMYSPLSHVSYGDVRGGTGAMGYANAALQGAGTGMVFGPIGAAVGAGVGLLANGIGDLFGASSAKREVRDLNRKIDEANQHSLDKFNNRVDYVDSVNDRTAMSNYFGKGGKIQAPNISNVLDYDLWYNKLMQEAEEEDKRYKGARRTRFRGNGNLHVFAEGGEMPMGMEGMMGNGVTSINEGGTHEENPNGGVPYGEDSQGTPNVVEEGEVIYDGFVYSDRIRLPEEYKETLGINLKRSITFAEAAELIQKESKERPNDPISQRSLKAKMQKLSEIQESVKQAEEQKKAEEQAMQDDQAMGMEQMQGMPEGVGEQVPMGGMPTMQGLQGMMGGSPNSFAGGGPIKSEYGVGSLLKDYIKDEWYKRNLENTISTNQSYQVNPEHHIAGKTLTVGEAVVKGQKPKPVSIKGDLYSNPNVLPHKGVQIQSDKINKSSVQNTTGIEPSIDTPERTPIPEVIYNTQPQSSVYPTWMRYAPAFSGVVGLANHLATSPDYSRADEITRVGNDFLNYNPITYTPLSNRMQYNPFDRNYYTNKHNATNAANIRAIENNSNGNHYALNNALLAAQYNANNQLGDLYRKAEEYNLAQRERVAQFNKDTDARNRQMAMTAAQQNAQQLYQAKQSRMQALSAALAMKDKIDANRNAALNANLSNIFNSLGAIGKENWLMNNTNSDMSLKYRRNADGTSSYKKPSDKKTSKKKGKKEDKKKEEPFS